ncbi:flagellar C1a complex subunit C1a-32-domain-containing protein [Haematococcus lacustris]
MVAIEANRLTQYWAQAPDSEEAGNTLAAVFHLPDYKTDARNAIRLDYFAYALQFAKDVGIGPARTASLLEVAQAILDATAAGATYADVEATFKSMMLQRTSSKPGADSSLFSPDQVSQAARFFARTFFRHHRLYAHVFSTDQELTECSASLMVETAVVPSFEEAMPEAEWQASIKGELLAVETAAQQAAQAQAAAAEAALQASEAAQAAEAARLRKEQLAKKPATLEEAIEHLVGARLESEKAALSAEYRDKEEALLARIRELESRATTPPAAPQAAPASAKK